LNIFFILSSISIFSGCTNNEDSDKNNNQNKIDDIEISQNIQYKIKSNISSDFIPLTSEEWNTNTVNKVLNTFTYGIVANKEQIGIWANMEPAEAIKEILNTNSFNLKLRNNENSFLEEHFNENLGLNDVREIMYDKYGSDVFKLHSRFSKGFVQSNLIAQNTNFNPFILKLGLWETNYHQVLTGAIDLLYIYDNYEYFDTIMDGIRNNLEYQTIMAHSAASSSILIMYNQLNNIYKKNTDELLVNDDFGREFNQLFFGILGEDDLVYYENKTIESTSRILTGFKLSFRALKDETSGETTGGRTFYPSATSFHFNQPVEANGQIIDNPDFKTGLSNLADVNINVEESLRNLPIIIIKGLADDEIELNENKKETVINAWKNMPNKNILEFIQNYAISNCFHSKDRVKYLSVLDKYYKIYNLLNFEDNVASSYGNIIYYLKEENYVIDIPAKGVFGNWTGEDVKNNTNVFANFYNNIVNGNFDNLFKTKLVYTKLLEKNNINQSDIKEVAEFLWSKLIGDNLKNFGHTERLEVYSLLYSGMDYNSLTATDTEPTKDNILNNYFMNQTYLMLENASLINEDNLLYKEKLLLENRKLINTIHFILGTPYFLYEEGR